MCLIPSFELGTILLAENDYIIGMQDKITTHEYVNTKLLEIQSVVSEFSH